jgi:hypothetical protein
MQADVLSFIDHTHSATSQLLDDSVHGNEAGCETHEKNYPAYTQPHRFLLFDRDASLERRWFRL